MAVTYGFYNSIDGDRMYNADQMSQIFDGIILDGVYMTIGNHLNVSVNNTTPMTVNVSTGRAWFNHTWTLNTAEYPITLEPSELLLNRIDAIVLEVNAGTSVRANSLKYVKGTPASNPQRPTLADTTTLHQHALAYVYVRAGASAITQADVTNVIGTSECPFVTGVLQGMNIDTLVAQWGSQWENWLSAKTSQHSIWWTEETEEFDEWKSTEKAGFETWLEHLADELDEHQAAHLQLQIDNITVVRTMSLVPSGWVATGTDFVQVLSVADVTEDSTPDIWVDRSNLAQLDDIDDAWNMVYIAVTGEGQITFHAKEKPTIALTIYIKGV